jgi:glutamate racemase
MGFSAVTLPVTARPKILVFDSGVGGLSVLDEIVNKRPDADLIYAADTQFLPYGLRSDAELKARVPALLKLLQERAGADLVVIACNTASTIALPETRALLAVPVVGTVPAIKPAAARSRSRIIGFLGTPRTVEREYSDALIRDFADGCTVIRHGSAELVMLAERKLAGEALPEGAVAAALAPMFARPGAERMDVGVLACTHFPLLRAEIEAASPEGLVWIDSGEAIARRVLHLLGQTCGAGTPRATAVFSTAPDRMRGAEAVFTGRGFPGFAEWDVP